MMKDMARYEWSNVRRSSDRDEMANLQSPPYNLEAERGVLSAIMLDESALHDVIDILKPDDFFRDSHKTVYQAILGVHQSSFPVEPLMVVEELKRQGTFDHVGGDDAIVSICESVNHSANAVYHAQIVRQKAISRQTIEVAQRMLKDAYSNTYTSDELVELAEKAVFAIADGRDAIKISTARDAINDSLYRLAERDDGVKPGLLTGFGKLDFYTGGLQKGHLIVLGARPSIGKTSLALNIAAHVSGRWEKFEDRASVLFVSLEMTRRELGDRLLCDAANVGGRQFMYSNQLQKDDRSRLRVAAERVSSWKIHIDDAPSRTITQIASVARRLSSREPIHLIVIDYLQLLVPDDIRSKIPRHEQVAAMSRRLKGLAKDLNVPVLLLSQLNREAERRTNKKPELSDIRESGAVEQDANIIMLLHRPEFYDKGDRPGEADLIIAKNRGGPTGTVKLVFEKELTRFTTLSNEPPPEAFDAANCF